MEYNFDEIGNRISYIRKENDFSQSDLVETFKQNGFNTTRSTISKIENGSQKALTLDFLLNFCKVFNCDIGFLMGEYDEQTQIKHQICEYTGLSEEAIRSITEYWNDIPEEWQECKVVLNALMESITLFGILSYISSYKENYLHKCALEKQAEQVLENACVLYQKQEDEECEETIIPKKEEIKFLRDSGYFDIREKCDVYLYRAQRLFSKFVEDYAIEGCDEWQTYKSEEIKTDN